MNPIGRAAAPLPPTPSGTASEADRAKLRTLAKQLEGVFVAQLFKAMRQSVPKSGLTDGGSGEETFTAMLDEKVAEKATARLDDRLGVALVRQLARQLPGAGDTRVAPTGAAAATPHAMPLGGGSAARPVPLAPHVTPLPVTPGHGRPAGPIPLTPGGGAPPRDPR